MKNLIEEFKTFAIKGNVIDLAVAVIIGSAFGKIVSSLVDDIIIPSINLIGNVNFSNWAPAGIKIGLFINNIVNFFIIALSVFMAIKFLNKLTSEIVTKINQNKNDNEDLDLQ